MSSQPVADQGAAAVHDDRPCTPALQLHHVGQRRVMSEPQAVAEALPRPRSTRKRTSFGIRLALAFAWSYACGEPSRNMHSSPPSGVCTYTAALSSATSAPPFPPADSTR